MKQFAMEKGEEKRRKRDGQRVEKTVQKNYLLYIFFNVVHRAKQLSKGHKLSNPSVYRCKQRLQRVMRQTMKERLMNLSPELLWRNSFASSESEFTNGDERSPSFRTIETSGNNWINVKRDKSVVYREGPDLSKRGSHGE